MKKQELIQNLQKELASFDSIVFVLCDEVEIKKFFPVRMNKISLDEEDYTELRQLYLTYEFSDKFRMISMDGNYGTIWNYVKTGLLTPEEAVEALLK